MASTRKNRCNYVITRRLAGVPFSVICSWSLSCLIILLLSLLVSVNLVLAAGNISVTRQFSPLANAANTSDGDMNGFETTPGNAYADDTSYAVDTDSGLVDNADPTGTATDKHDYYNYGLLDAIPSGANITGITVRADIAVDDTKDEPFTAIRLSWDGGTSWTAVKQFTLTGTVETTYTYGGVSDNWGHAWTTSELSDANFRVQVINGDAKSNKSDRDFSLDWIPVSITFTAPWDSHTDMDRADPAEDTFAAPDTTVYMKGTGFAISNYTVGYYDGAVASGGNLTAVDENIIVNGTGILNSQYLLTTDPNATAGTWHALVQPASGYTALPSDYNVAVGAPDTYGLLANDSFTVEQSAIPEFPTVLAGIVVAGSCFGIYYWMRKRRGG